MHPSALNYGKLFFEKYCADISDALVCDIGAQNVNGSLKDVMPSSLQYLGVDFVQGAGVDVVLDDPYKLPFEDEKFDAIVCSSCFEHSEFFWLVFLEMLRVLKPHGLLYLNVPSNGAFHRYPVDCWRFYPDAGGALQAWGTRAGYQPKLLESFVGAHDDIPYATTSAWHDYVAVFVKDTAFANRYPQRILTSLDRFWNGVVADQPGVVINERVNSPDHEAAAELQAQVASQVQQMQQQAEQLQNTRHQLQLSQQQLQHTQLQVQAVQSELQESVRLLKEMNAAIDAIQSTFSWRVTKPLRWIRSMLP